MSSWEQHKLHARFVAPLRAMLECARLKSSEMSLMPFIPRQIQVALLYSKKSIHSLHSPPILRSVLKLPNVHFPFHRSTFGNAISQHITHFLSKSQLLSRPPTLHCLSINGR
jgi:hypothetical protein